MLTTRDDHVDDHFSDKFVPMCHVDYFINSDGWKLMARYICCIFLQLWRLNFVFSSFRDAFVSELHIKG